jgi:hypothetical protein
LPSRVRPKAWAANGYSSIGGEHVRAAVNRPPKVTTKALRAAFQLIQICFELEGTFEPVHKHALKQRRYSA